MTSCRSETGLSMIEVMIGISLFAVIAAGLASTTVATIRANSTSKQITAAAALVQNKLEQLRSLDPAAAPADLTPGTHADPANPLTPLDRGGGTFTRTWQVTPNTPALKISRVAVTVSWTGLAGSSMTGVTYVCETQTCN